MILINPTMAIWPSNSVGQYPDPVPVTDTPTESTLWSLREPTHTRNAVFTAVGRHLYKTYRVD